jgi:hypothetical protein
VTARAFWPAGCRCTLNRGRGTTEAIGDLPDRQPLDITVVMSECDDAAPLADAVASANQPQ